MALMYDARWRAIDASGNPLTGATLTVYTANTTNPAAIFRDAALATPMSNPTSGADKSDSAGYFPQVFAVEGTSVDIILKNAAGNTLASYEDVSFVGATNSSLIRDFTNARFQARGAGGTVFIEGGDPTGDDTGGKLNFGGWNGTQADLITLNGASVNVVGTLTENSHKLPGIVRTEGTFSAVASQAIQLVDEGSTVAWQLDLTDLVHAGGAITAQFATDQVPTWITAANYQYTDLTGTAATGRIVAGSSTGVGHASYRIWGAVDATTRAAHMSGFYGNTGSNQHVTMDYTVTIAKPTWIKLIPAAGTLSGRYRVIPLRGL